uniref:Uncharacterized protein n=1 Tax=Rhodnius prolixus TaxID=13249 RepID=T1HIH5_RHOPR
MRIVTINFCFAAFAFVGRSGRPPKKNKNKKNHQLVTTANQPPVPATVTMATAGINKPPPAQIGMGGNKPIPPGITQPDPGILIFIFFTLPLSYNLF